MVLPQLVNTGFQVLFHSPPGVLFTFPSQYSALSVTKEYLALRGGPRFFPQGFSCLVVLRIPLCPFVLRLRGFHPLRQVFPDPFCWSLGIRYAVLNPGMLASRFGLFRFRSPLLPESLVVFEKTTCCFLFLRLLRCFSSPGSLCPAMDLPGSGGGMLRRVSPFRNPWIAGYLHLPMAFRSLSRLSSALSAKASTLCSFLLNLLRQTLFRNA